jgi:molecular chaperone DnaJ
MPALRGGGSGDMVIELAVETPVNLTARQREILQEFDTLASDNNPEGTSFFAKVKGFWDGMKS